MRVGSIVMDAANLVAARPWYEIVRQTLKRNEVKLVTYVPDKVFTPLIKNLHADPTSLRFRPRARRRRSASCPAPGWADGAGRC